MERRIATGLVCCGMFLCVGVLLSASEARSGSLVARQKWLRFVLRQGRVCLVMPKGHAATLVEDYGEIAENLAADYKGPVPRLRYERHTSDEVLYLQFFDTQDFLLELERSNAGGYRLKVRQSPGHSVVVEKFDHAGQAGYVGHSFWHLGTTYPHIRTELIACLELLRPDWRLDQQIELVERQLHASLPTCSVPQVQQCIEQLGSHRFAEREAAYRKLKSFGSSVLPSLMHINMDRLTTEQRMRIEKLRLNMQSMAEDSPPQVAAWLANDPQYWLQRASVAQHVDRQWAEERWRLLMASEPTTGSLRVASDGRPSTHLHR